MWSLRSPNQKKVSSKPKKYQWMKLPGGVKSHSSPLVPKTQIVVLFCFGVANGWKTKQHTESEQKKETISTWEWKITWVVPPPRMPVTTRIIPFLVGNPYKPSFPLLLGEGTTQKITLFRVGTRQHIWIHMIFHFSRVPYAKAFDRKTLPNGCWILIRYTW